MSVIISVMNQKGGVGKTTIAFNLIRSLASKRYKCLAIDNDPQKNLTNSFTDERNTKSDVVNYYNEGVGELKVDNIDKFIDLIASSSALGAMSDTNSPETICNLADNIQEISDKYDFIIIDTVPSFGHLNTSALIASDYMLVPTTADNYAIAGLADLMVKFAKVRKLKNKIGGDVEISGIVLNNVEGRKTVMQSELEEALREEYKALVFNTVINKSIKFSESPTFNQSIMEYDKNGKSAKQFNKFVAEFLKRVQKNNKSKKEAA